MARTLHVPGHGRSSTKKEVPGRTIFESVAFCLEAAGLLLFVAALLITLRVNVPIDNQIKQWTLATLPTNWEKTRDRWELYHSLRTLASLGGLGCVIASALLDSQ
jgi:uncharacterized membrane protein